MSVEGAFQYKDFEEETLEPSKEQEQQATQVLAAEDVLGAEGGLTEDFFIGLPEPRIKHPRATREVDPDLELMMQEPKDQRVTRAAEKQRQEKQKQQMFEMPQEMKGMNGTPQKSEAVGGARPKTSVVEQSLRQVLGKLRESSDGS